jgi:hypothetical protein
MPDDVSPQLIAYRIHKYPSLPIVPASSQRRWMDQTRERFAYRCLPLLIANQNGWFILNVHKIRVVWTGGDSMESLKIICRAGPPQTPCPAASHFGHGVLTWNLNYLFRTSPGYNLWARGPSNHPKDGITALEGIIETDWSVATFTMNWKVTTPNHPIDFEPGEPICMITPVKRGETETFQPMVRDLDTEPEVAQKFQAWARSRDQFNADLRRADSQAVQQQWQKDYVQGHGPGVTAREHQTKLSVRGFQLPAPPSPPQTS